MGNAHDEFDPRSNRAGTRLDDPNGVVKVYTVPLTKAQVQALNTTPQLLVPGKGGFIHVLLKLLTQWEITSVYTSSPIMQVRYVGGSGAFANILEADVGALFAGTTVAKRSNQATAFPALAGSSASATSVFPTGRGLELYMASALTGSGNVVGFSASAIVATIPGI